MDMPGDTGVTHDAIIRPSFSSSTMQRRHAPNGLRFGWWYRVGVLIPFCMAASRMLVPGRQFMYLPLIVSLTSSNPFCLSDIPDGLIFRNR